jgi:hypothetical protein
LLCINKAENYNTNNLNQRNQILPMTVAFLMQASKVTARKPIIALHNKAKRGRDSPSPSSKMTESTPLLVLQSILVSQEDKTAPKSLSSSLSFTKPPEKDIDAYDLESVRAIRSSNLERLRQLWADGKCLDACNQFGESLLHMACRRGDLGIVTFLVCEAKVQTNRCDDFGRNPFHDALWTSTPNFEVMDLLLDHADPSLLLAEDVRGNTPFAYARKEHSAKWINFLEQRRKKLQQRIAETAANVAASNEKIEEEGV